MAGKTAQERPQIQKALQRQVMISGALGNVKGTIPALPEGDPCPRRGVGDKGPWRRPRDGALDPHLRQF